MSHIFAKPEPGSWRDFTQVHPVRGLTLTAIGAVLGLGLAGYALFTAKGVSTLVVPPDAVAVVNQQPIARIDYLGIFKTLGEDPETATPQRRREVLDTMIREELFVQRAKELDVAGVDSDVRAAMVAAVEQQTAASALATRPSDAELRAWYDAHKSDYASEGRLVLRDLVFPTLASATSAIAALRRGAVSDAVLTRLGGRDTGRVRGEEFYFAARIHLGEALFAQAKTLSEGQVSAPLPQADGVHVLVVARNLKPVVASFDAARGQVLSDFIKAAITRFEHADEHFLRKRANILIAPDLRS